MTEETGLLSDPHIWVLFSTLVFAVIAFVKGRKPLMHTLDSRTARIKSELEEASSLRQKAQALLDDYQKKHRDAVQTAQKIIDNAHESAEMIRKDMMQKCTENLKRREELLLERIARAEATAVQELRSQAADIAANAAETLLADAIGKRGPKLVDDAIAELSQRLG